MLTLYVNNIITINEIASELKDGIEGIGGTSVYGKKKNLFL